MTNRQRADTGRAGRRQAGEDPAKRRQILDGAYRVFLTRGFDAASMDDITREAGVSKGTVYVYFSSKLDLFEALIEGQRQLLTAELGDILADGGETADVLRRFGLELVRLATRPDVIRAQRTVIAMSERMPEIGRRYFEAGPGRSTDMLRAYLSGLPAGRGPDMEPGLAARLFFDMCVGTATRERLYRQDSDLDLEETGQIVDAAVGLLLPGSADYTM